MNETVIETNVVEILIVEDTPQDLDLALRALRKAGLANRIQVARDGVEACDFIFCEGEHGARKMEDGPKVILLDLKLPKIDGLEVLQRIKSDSRTKTIPVVVLTSSKEQNDVVESYNLGVNSYIVKPVNFEQLSEAVQKLGMLAPAQSSPATGRLMSHHLKILLVEDNLEDAELIMRELRRAEFDFEHQRVDTENGFIAGLSPGIDLILSDYAMPQFSGLRALELLKKQPSLDIPFIIVSGTIGEEMAVTAMQQGAADYLLKDRIQRLGPAVKRVLEGVRERTERKRYEAQFIEAQKMEVIGQLAAGVAHDFNNVLAVIMGYSDLIKQDLGPEHELQKYVDEVRQAARRAAGLTQQLLIFSRKQTVQPVELDLNEVIMGMEKMLRQLINENVEMTMLCKDHIGHIKADSGYVWQVLMNLVVNARDAMPHGGKLTIKTGIVELDENDPPTKSDLAPGPYVTLSVSDTGVGMTEEVKQRLFEAFFTTKVAGKGTGLGLLTCQTIIKQSGGHIEVESAAGTGTTFTIYFPRIEQVAAVPVISRKTAPIRLGTETILVVEDEPSLRHLAQGVLQGRGYNVLTAPNGQDALRVVRENTGPPLRLVISDVIMPRMGGKVMAEWLKITYPDLKILFTSGYTEDAIAHHGVLEGGVDFLPKPYTPANLARKVREMLDA